MYMNIFCDSKNKNPEDRSELKTKKKLANNQNNDLLAVFFCCSCYY